MLPARRELGGDLRCELLAELDTPLVERVDAPDRRLREDAVLVQRERARPASPARAPARGSPTSAGSPAGRGAGPPPPARPRPRDSSALRPTASACAWAMRLAARRSCCSRASSSGERATRTRSTGTRPCPGAGTGRPPCCAAVPVAPHSTAPVSVSTGSPVSCDALAERLHRQLLEVGGKQPERGRVRDDRGRLRAEEAPVPDGEQAGDRGQVPLRAAPREVLVQRVEAAEQLPEPLCAERDHRREPGGGAERRPSADPVPDRNTCSSRDPERGRGVRTRAETPTKCRSTASPSPTADAIQARAALAFASVSSVDAVFETTTKSVSRGSRSRVARARSTGSTFATNRNAMSGAARSLSASYAIAGAEGSAPIPMLPPRGSAPRRPAPPERTRSATAPFGRARRGPATTSTPSTTSVLERGMRSATWSAGVLRDVQLPAEHRAYALGEPALGGEPPQELERVVRDEVLRVVEIEARRLGGEALSPGRVGLERVAEVEVAELGDVPLEPAPGGGLRQQLRRHRRAPGTRPPGRRARSTALPGTSRSAPAPRAIRMVSALIPPSTCTRTSSGSSERSRAMRSTASGMNACPE